MKAVFSVALVSLTFACSSSPQSSPSSVDQNASLYFAGLYAVKSVSIDPSSGSLTAQCKFSAAESYKAEEAQAIAAAKEGNKVCAVASGIAYFDMCRNLIPQTGSYAQVSEALHYVPEILCDQRMRQLEDKDSLFIRDAGLTEVSALVGLPKLSKLYLEGNQIAADQLAELSGIPNLSTLSLINNKLSDVSGLAGLTKLELLELDDNPEIVDISRLAVLPVLGIISVSGTGITEQTDLSMFQPGVVYF